MTDTNPTSTVAPSRAGQALPANGRPVALPPKLKVYAYEYDQTGRAVQNKIVHEAHTITPQNRSRFNVIIPQYAPYFRRSLEIVDQQTGHQLIEGIDYTCEWRVVAASDRTEDLAPIYGGIQFIDNEITGTFLITYQTIGGQFTIGSTEIAQALANQANDPLVTNYDDIIGRPLTFPPLEHVHSIREFVGFEHLVTEVTGVKDAILLLAKEDRDSHPGYDTLVDEYFKLVDTVRNVASSQATFKQDLLDTISVNRAEALREIQTAKDNLLQQLQQSIRDNDEKIKQLTASLTSKIQQLTDRLNNDFESFKQQTNQSITQINQTVEQNKNDLEAKLEQAKTSMNSALTSAKNEMNRSFEAFKQQTNQALQDQANQINGIRDTLSGRITALETAKRENDTKNQQQDGRLTNVEEKNTSQDNEIAALKRKDTELTSSVSGLQTTYDANGGPVKLQGDQVVGGAKTFTSNLGLRNQNDPSKTASLGFNSTGLTITNPTAGSNLQLKNDGKLLYNNVELPNLTTVTNMVNEAKRAGADWNTNLRNIPATLMHNNRNYVTINPPSAGVYTGLEMNINGGGRYCVELEANNGRWKLYRSSGGGQVYFPKETADQEVAYRSWVQAQIDHLQRQITENTNFRNSFTFEF